MKPIRFPALAGAVALLAGALAGCAEDAKETPQAPDTTSSPAPPESIAPEPETKTAEPQGPVIPATCEEVLPVSTVQSYHGQLEHYLEGAEAEAKLSSMLGPVTMSTLQGGEQKMYCGWGIWHSDAIAYLGVAVTGEQAKMDLLAALRDSVYEEVQPVEGSEARFVQGQTEAHRYVDEIIIGKELLVAATHTISGNFAQDAFTGVQD